MVTNEGLQWLQENDLAAATLYLLLIDDDGYSALSPDDTMSSHDGWDELTDYSQSTRPQWVNNGSAAGYIDNTPGALFTASAAFSVRGGALVTNSTKGGSTGILIATGVIPTGFPLDRLVGEAIYLLFPIRYKAQG